MSHSKRNESHHTKDGIIDFTAGFLGGVALVYVGQPLDTVKVKMQTFPSLYGNMIHCFKHTFLTDGIAKGLYAGTVPALVANVGENSVLFLGYGFCQKFMQNATRTDDVSNLSTLSNATAGFLAAFFSSLVLCPTELIKCKLQAMYEVEKQEIALNRAFKRVGPFSLTAQILRSDGVTGLFRGLTPTLMREMPGYFFFFGGYEGNNTVSFCIPIEGKEKFLIGYGRQVAAITWDGVSDKVTDFQKIAEVDIEDDLTENRINDAKCDQSGRLWFGTMGAEPEIAKIIPHKGSLYSLGIDDQIKRHLSEVTCSNGLAWSADNTNFYYIDSGTYEIHQYDFDIASGEISNKKVVFSLKEVSIEGFADGHTIDTDGNLWVAIFNGSKVIKIDPRRKNALLQTVDIPAKQVTSVTFGGPNFDELYVTTAGVAGNDSMLPSPNGAIFRLTGLGVKGFGGVRAK